MIENINEIDKLKSIFEGFIYTFQTKNNLCLNESEN